MYKFQFFIQLWRKSVQLAFWITYNINLMKDTLTLDKQKRQPFTAFISTQISLHSYQFQMAKMLGSKSVRYLCDTEAFDWCLIDDNLMVFAVWVFNELFPRLFKLTWFFNSKYHMAKHIYNTGLEFNCQCNGVHPKLRAKLQLMAVTSQIIIPCTGSFIGCISALVHLMAWHWIGNRS